MAARREHPLARGRDVETLFDRLLGGWLAPFDQDVGSMRLWGFEVTENGDEVVVRAELPGFEENELDVQINKDVLTIKAEKEEKGDGAEEYQAFYRTVTLPPGLDPEKARATYRNGVLELHIPRAEGAQPKQIKIEGMPAQTGQQRQQAKSNQAGAVASQAGDQGQKATNQAGAKASEKAEK
jgi:HSP20 family protein